MALDVEVGSFTLNTGTGNQTISLADSGLTGKVVLLFATNGTSDGNRAHAKTSFGVAASSTSRWSVVSASEDNLGTMDNSRAVFTDSCLRLINDTITGWQVIADFVSFSAGQFVINISTAPASALRVWYLVLGGSDITNVGLGTFLTATSTGNQDTDVGFTPDSLILVGGKANAGDGITNSVSNFIGVGAGSTIARGVTSWYARDNVGTSQTGRYQRTNAILAYANPATDSIAVEADLTAWLSGVTDGFRLNYSSAIATQFLTCYLALEGANFKVDTITTVTNTNEQTESGVGFTASAGLFTSFCNAASASVVAEWEASVGISDGTNDRTTHTLDEDNVGTSDTYTSDDDSGVYLNYDNTGTKEGELGINAFDADGFTWQHSDADPSANEVIYWLIGALEGPALTISVSDSVTIAETVAASVESPTGDLSLSVSDSVTVAEAVDADFIFEISVSDSVTVAETVDALIVSLIDVSDSVTVAETVAVDFVFEVSVSDSVTVAETVTADVSDPLVSVSDSVTVAETVDAEIAYEISVSDSVTVAETVDVEVVFEISVSDSVTVAETVDVDFVFEIAVSDSVTIAETVDAEIAYEIVVSDSVLITEAVAADVSDPLVAVSDSATLAETVSVDVIFEVSVSDSVTVAETVAADVSDPLISVSDSVTLAETVDVDFIFEIAVSDSVTVAETVNVAVGGVVELTISVSDSVTLAETVSALIVSLVSVADTVTLAETILVAVSAPEISVTDTVTLAETVETIVVSLVDVSDSVTVTETVFAEVSAPEISVTDTVTLAESVNTLIAAPGDINVVVSDAILVAETTVAAFGFDVEVSDSVGVAETVLLNVELLPLGVEISFDNLDSWTQGVKVIG